MTDRMRSITVVTIMVVLLAALLMSACQEADSGAGAVALESYEVMATLDMEKHADFMHPDALQQLKDRLWPALDAAVAADSTAAQSPLVMTLGLTIEDGKLVDLPARQLYVNLMKMVVAQSPNLANSLQSSAYEVIGEVLEGENLSHVVMRARSIARPESLSRVEVVTLMKYEDGWKLALSPELEGMAIGMANMLVQPRNG